MTIQKCVSTIKKEIETCIKTKKFNGKEYDNGAKAKESLIRSSQLIEHLHDCVKESLTKENVKKDNIYPPLKKTKPEIKVTGLLKQKKQDITVVPSNIDKSRRVVDWEPLKHENIIDKYGQDYTSNCLIINVRSQLSSLAKNADTLFERTFAEAINIHKIYPKAVLGEIYLIPVYEYDQKAAKKNKVKFSRKRTNLEKYISFFCAINNRISENDDDYKYEKCCLLIVDFSKKKPIVYSTTDELKRAKLLDENFKLELQDISYDCFIEDLLQKYNERHNIENIIKE